MTPVDKLVKVLRTMQTTVTKTDEATDKVLGLITEMDEAERVWAIFTLASVAPPYLWERLEAMPDHLAEGSVSEIQGYGPGLK